MPLAVAGLTFGALALYEGRRWGAGGWRALTGMAFSALSLAMGFYVVFTAEVDW